MKTEEKILHTIGQVFILLVGLILAIKVYAGYLEGDDDMMCICGLLLMAFTCIIFLFELVMANICQLWYKSKKKTNKKEKKDEKKKV